jgi:hypothetical protein
VSRESKVLIGVGAIVVVGFVIVLARGLTVGLIVMAVGILGCIVALRLTRPDTSDPFADMRTEADETQVGNITPSQPLAPWSPDGGLNAWTPPVSFTALPEAPPTAEAPPEVVEPPAPAPSWSDGWSNADTWDSTTWDPAATPTDGHRVDTNPLDELEGLDTLDPIAEVERIEARSADEAPPDLAPLGGDDHRDGFSFGATTTKAEPGFDFNGNPVNEDVAGADDIMAASQATELHLAAGEQTELQKLLAKVQIRLSAYE